jgi:hypothetical protein
MTPHWRVTSWVRLPNPTPAGVPWFAVPRWHWRYWLGYPFRRRYLYYHVNGIPHWEYATPRRVAREQIEELFG